MYIYVCVYLYSYVCNISIYIYVICVHIYIYDIYIYIYMYWYATKGVLKDQLYIHSVLINWVSFWLVRISLSHTFTHKCVPVCCRSRECNKFSKVSPLCNSLYKRTMELTFLYVYQRAAEAGHVHGYGGGKMYWDAYYSGALQCVAVCCSVLQCVAVCFSVLQWHGYGSSQN